MGVLAFLLFVWLLMQAAKDAHGIDTRRGGGSGSGGGGGGGGRPLGRLAPYGRLDHWADARRDAWNRRTDGLIAARNEQARRRANGEAPLSLRDRWDVMRRGAVNPPVPQPVPPPAGPAQPAAKPPPTPAPSKPAGGSEPVSPPAPEPAAAEPPKPAAADTPPADTPAQPSTPAPSSNGNGATPMTQATSTDQPTGEVMTYEQAVAHHDKMDQVYQRLLDKAINAANKISEAEEAVEAMQADHVPAQGAAQTASEHYAAANVDSQTQAHAGETVDVLDAVDMESMFDWAAGAKAKIAAAVTKYEAARATNQAAKDNLIKRYADAQETVNNDLSGDSRFLNHNGGGSAASTSQPATAGATT